MKVRFFNIKWDTTDEDNPQGQDVDLPSECVLEVYDKIDLDTEGADALSDEYGWCVFGFEYEKIVEDNCSNCEFARCRRSQVWCGGKESEHYQTLTSLRFKCDKHVRGGQWEIMSSDEKTVIYPD